MSSQITSRAALIKGSPFGKRTCEKDPDSYLATGMYYYDGSPIWNTPKNKDMKLPLDKIAAKETYKGLGTGIKE